MDEAQLSCTIGVIGKFIARCLENHYGSARVQKLIPRLNSHLLVKKQAINDQKLLRQVEMIFQLYNNKTGEEPQLLFDPHFYKKCKYPCKKIETEAKRKMYSNTLQHNKR